MGVLGTSSELQVSNLSFDVTEHPSVEAWLSGLENGNTNDKIVLEECSLVTDSTLPSGILMIGEEWERLYAP